MQRVFVGFSAPVGYSYRAQRRPAPNDKGSSPEPVLYGSMGLLLMYDEIWFACESLCPDSMRSLKYVKFLDRERANADIGDLPELIEEDASIFDHVKTGLEDVFDGSYGDEMTAYLGRSDTGTDNHTHGLDFLGQVLGGNLGSRQLLTDSYLIDKFSDLKMDVALNNKTVKMALHAHGDTDTTEDLIAFNLTELADKIITITSLYDIVGAGGPYHPCIEDMRGDDLLVEFRRWMKNDSPAANRVSRLVNSEMKDIQEDINARIADLHERTLRKYVERKSLANIAVDFLKDGILDLVPGAAPIHKFLERRNHNKKVDEIRWQAFVASSRAKLDNAKRNIAKENEGRS